MKLLFWIVCFLGITFAQGGLKCTYALSKDTIFDPNKARIYDELSENHFIIPFNNPNYYYFKIQIKGSSNALDEELTLEVEPNVQPFLQLYEKTDSGYVFLKDFSEALVWGDRLEYKNVHNFYLKPGLEFLIVCKTEGDILAVRAKVVNKKKFFKFQKYEKLGHSFVYGMAILMVMQLIIMLLLTRRTILLFLLLFYLFAFSFKFVHEGFGKFYLFEHMIYSSQALYSGFLHLALGAHLLFVQHYFNYNERFPLLNTFFTSIVVVEAFTAIAILFNFELEYIYTANFFLPIISLGSGLLGFSFVNKKRKEHQVFLLTYLLLILCLTFYSLSELHLIKDYWIFSQLFAFGLIMHALMFIYMFSNDLFRRIQKNKLLAIKRLKQLNMLNERHNNVLEEKVKIRTKMYETIVDELVEAKKDVLNSIDYAKQIQDARLQSENELKEVAVNSFVIYEPQNIVSGDFYMLKKLYEDHIVMLVGDGTGHGVPGGFMSFIGLNLCEKYIPSIIKKGLARTLQKLNEDLHVRLKYDQKNLIHIRDGFDLGVLLINVKDQTFEYCGAKINLKVVMGDELLTFKGSRISLGSDNSTVDKWKVEKGYYNDKTSFYISTDGIIDQFGGAKKEKFKSTRLNQLLLKLQKKPFNERKPEIVKSIKDWRGNEEQIDDICILGLNLNNEDL